MSQGRETISNGSKPRRQVKGGRRARERHAGQPAPGDIRSSLSKGLEILSLFKPTQPVLSVEEIAQAVDLPKSSTYRLVATLRDQGFLRRLPGTAAYTVDHRLLRAAEVSRAGLERYLRAARPRMEELARDLGETVVLVFRSGDRGVITEKAESDALIRYMPDVGLSFPLYRCSPGKVLLAGLPETELVSHLKRVETNGAAGATADSKGLTREIGRVRLDGFAIVNEEFMAAIRSVAVPVPDDTGDVIAALSVGGPSGRFTDRRARESVALLTACAERISMDFSGVARPR
jgi:DNA-binding IclR family transcriptional regulator